MFNKIIRIISDISELCKQKTSRGTGRQAAEREETMKTCSICPRNCEADRAHGAAGVCGQTEEIRVARAALHYWEEPCISGREGSGAVFFSGCALRCVYCQNRKIAQENAGRTVSGERLAEIFLNLQEQGANNINLVTAGHFVPQLIPVIESAKRAGLAIPIVYNSGGYERVETLRALEGLVDIYLPDFKYMSPRLGARYSHAPDYADVAKRAVEEMVRQTGPAVFADGDEDGLMRRGTVVRHLVLPGCVDDAKAVIRYLYETYGDDIYISIMNQFTPLPALSDYPEINRRVTEEEYDVVVDYAIALGVECGFIQEGETAEESFIPEFDGEGLL